MIVLTDKPLNLQTRWTILKMSWWTKDFRGLLRVLLFGRTGKLQSNKKTDIRLSNKDGTRKAHILREPLTPSWAPDDDITEIKNDH
jgi:hypothetical protein